MIFEAIDIRLHHIGPLSLAVAAGDCLGITGPSGTGKSLLLRALADMEPAEGNIFWKETERRTVSGPEWRKRIGLMPAESQWWFETVGEHFGEETDFSLVGFEKDVKNWEIHRLSSGEKQRLALLRLLGRSPDVLLLDEPTANLDPANTLRIEALIMKIRKKRNLPVIWVSHSEDQLYRMADAIRVFANGALTPLAERPKGAIDGHALAP